MDPLNSIREWLWRSSAARDLAGHVYVRTDGRGPTRRTVVEIEHSVSAPAGWPSGWRVTTTYQFLPSHHFHPEPRRVVRAADATGWRLYCLNLDNDMQEVIAALTFGIDDRPHMPVMLGALAMRIDANAHPDLYDRSRGGALVLLAYLRVVARRLGRGEEIHADVREPAAVRELRRLGFESAPPEPGFRPSGTYLRWRPTR